jgi:hypothetical protein
MMRLAFNLGVNVSFVCIQCLPGSELLAANITTNHLCVEMYKSFVFLQRQFGFHRLVTNITKVFLHIQMNSFNVFRNVSFVFKCFEAQITFDSCNASKFVDQLNVSFLAKFTGEYLVA